MKKTCTTLVTPVADDAAALDVDVGSELSVKSPEELAAEISWDLTRATADASASARSNRKREVMRKSPKPLNDAKMKVVVRRLFGSRRK